MVYALTCYNHGNVDTNPSSVNCFTQTPSSLEICVLNHKFATVDKQRHIIMTQQHSVMQLSCSVNVS